MSQRDDFSRAILQFLIAKSFEGESQIDERIDWNAETKGRVPLVQALTATVGLTMSMVGLFLLGWQATWLLGLDLDVFGALLVATFALILLLLLMAAIRALTNSYSAGVLVVLAASLVILLAMGALAYASDRELSMWHGFALIAGMALLMPGLALTYRQLADLIDPFGKTSPLERMLYPYLGTIFGEQGEPVQPEPRRLVPFRHNGAVSAVSTGTGARYDVHPDDLDLLAFIREASQRGLAREALVTKPRIKLRPTGTEITRGVYDAMMRRASEEWGFIDRGGEGHPAHWLVEPSTALGVLEAEIQRIRGEA